VIKRIANLRNAYGILGCPKIQELENGCLKAPYMEAHTALYYGGDTFGISIWKPLATRSGGVFPGVIVELPEGEVWDEEWESATELMAVLKSVVSIQTSMQDGLVNRGLRRCNLPPSSSVRYALAYS